MSKLGDVQTGSLLLTSTQGDLNQYGQLIGIYAPEAAHGEQYG